MLRTFADHWMMPVCIIRSQNWITVRYTHKLLSRHHQHNQETLLKHLYLFSIILLVCSFGWLRRPCSFLDELIDLISSLLSFFFKIFMKPIIPWYWIYFKRQANPSPKEWNVITLLFMIFKGYLFSDSNIFLYFRSIWD